MKKYLIALACLMFIVFMRGVYSNSTQVFANKTFGGKTAVLVADASGNILYQWQAEKTLVPASVLKILTAQVALSQWGREHQFKTDFYLEGNTLWVKGYGDPFLVSEELDLIGTVLMPQLESHEIDGIGVDATYFNDAKIASRTSVNDPYNAPLSAVAANFNTIYISKSDKKVTSAEPQTPITPTAVGLAKDLKNGKHRINVGDALTGQQHFAELLGAKLRSRGIGVGNNVLLGNKVPLKAILLYRHVNSNQLDDVLRGTLEYSNNFIANQLFMMLGTSEIQKVAELGLAKLAVATHLRNEYGESRHWLNFSMEEGAGLSRKNSFSAKQLLDILRDFEPNKTLLKSYQNGLVRAKTGTLKGVRTLAGYIDIKSLNGIESYYFIFLFNEPTPYRHRETLLDELVTVLKQY